MDQLSERLARLSPDQLAALMQRLRGQAAHAAATRIPRRSDDGECRLSFAQQRLWFVQQLDPQDEEERRLVLDTWSRTDTAYSVDVCIHARFEAQVQRTPDAVALVSGDESLSYAELDARANRLANLLVRRGVGPEMRVGICLERGPEMVVAILGVLKAGGAYVPLDPGYPAERLAYMLADSAPAAVLVQTHLRDRVERADVPVLELDATAPAWASLPATNPGRGGLTPDHLAYVIYTSGSTGRPKGVRVSHGSLGATLAVAGGAFGFGAGDWVPSLASFAFDIWLFETLLPLLGGGTVRLVPRDRVLDVPRLVEDLAWCTALHAVPALMRRIVEEVRATPEGVLGTLRRAFVGGDAVAPDLLEEMRRAFPAAEIHVLYGPTEGAIICAAHRLGGEPAARQMVGRPLGNATLYVVEPGGTVAPVGVPGELCLGGASVARDYLGRPGLTAERFVPDPFSAQPGARLYRTGDLVRWLEDGTLEYLGRLDEQVKVRGFRIEPGEIEAVLRRHESVAECAVVVREDEAGERRLAAYVVPVPRKDVELWPSIGEYFVYDDLIYHGLTHDTGRNARYLRALQRHAPGKVVLDVGTGADAILARLAVEAGARHVYAVELLERSYLSARERIRTLGLEDRITVIHGDARTVELPEPAEVCVSEIVESIAGGEGAAVILDQARRLLAPGAVMIPGWARTRVAAVTLPDELRHEIGFSPTAAHYVKGIFEEVGYPFDLRLCIRNFPADHVLSTAGTYEELDFGAGPVDAEYTRREELVVERAGQMDGLLLWLRMALAEGEELDILEEETAWFPVYFPLFEPGIEVAAGDQVRLECWAEIPEGVAPDYGVRGVLVRARDGEEVPFEFVSHHHRRVFRASPFYRRLFTDGEVPSLAERRETLPASLREHVQRSLPEYMVPAAFVALERLPLTPNGKLDRRALPAPELASTEGRYVAPRTPVEEVLAGIWAEVLRRERVGVEESFFALGGHSLLATRVVSRVRELFGVELPLRALFEEPTVAEMTLRVDSLLRDGGDVHAPPVVPVPHDGPLPLSFVQERLWLLQQLDPASAAYSMPFALRLRGRLDADALERALTALAARHASLRTRLVAVDGAPVQVIDPPGPVPIPLVDLAGVDEAIREATLRELAAAEALRPFDLAAGPLLRCTRVRLGDEEHALFFVLHHVVSDGWSMAVLVREVSELYGAFFEGRVPSLPLLPVQYADYAVWQRGWLTGDVLDAQLAYWRGALADVPALELPLDRPRPPVQTYRGAGEPLVLSAELSDALRALGRREGATLFMTLVAALQLLLSRLSGQEDFAVGSPVAGRTRGETEGLIGCFLNNLVLRADLRGDPSFRELLGRVREAMLGAYAHQDVPFEKLIDALRPPRDPARTPFFQVLANLVPGDDGARLRLGSAAVEGLDGGVPQAKFDLSLYITDGAEIGVWLVYNADLFDAATVRGMLGSWQVLLEAAAAAPERRVSTIPLLRPEERAGLAAAVRHPRPEVPFAPFPGPAPRESIAARFAAQVRAAPQGVAVETGLYRWTYAELDERANRVAHALLRACGASPSRVALFLDHDAPMLAGVLGALRAGTTYVPLNPAYPPERVKAILEDGEPAALLVEAAYGERVRDVASGLPVLVLEEVLATGSADAVELEIDPDAPAYILYTSGSTGEPKGVVQSHRNVLQHIRTYANRLHLGPGDRLSLFSAYGFDAAVMDIYGALLSGATLCPISLRGEAGADLPGEVVRRGITVFHSTPTVYRHLAAQLGGHDLSRVRLVVLGGEEVVPHDLELFRRHFAPGALFVNGFGPTECTIALQHFTDARTAKGGSVPLGWAVEGTEVQLLNADGEPVETFATGEITVRAAHVALGYWRRPELTDAAFLPDPEGGARRVYRTGDFGRLLPDGAIAFAGRRDGQVKIRGFRIETGEIESVLRADPRVRECAVVAREDAGEKRLVAYVVAAEGAGLSPAALRAQVRERLPDHMVPAAIVSVDHLPLMPNGKLDRRALPAPPAPEAEPDAYVAPRTPGEEVLAGIFADVLRAERVGVETSFFELGGHSLMATRVISRIRDVMAVEVPLRAIFEKPTVADLAGTVEALRMEGLPQLPPVVHVDRDGPLPLSFAQERLWFLDRLQPGGTAYNLSLALRLSGALDAGALERSLGEVMRRHEALRTTFAEDAGVPVQVIAPFGGFALAVEDLSTLAEDGREAAIRDRAAAEGERPFDLAAGPLFRAALLRLGDEEHVLLITMHHVVSDGWSMGVLFREMVELYGAFREGRESPLPELPVQYADHAVWQREQLQGEVLDRQLAWWKDRLAGAPEVLELPTDRPRPAIPSQRGGTVSTALSADVLQRLEALARSEGATLYMVMLGAFQALLSRYGGSDDVVVGTPIAGRTRKEVEGLIGFFVNTLVLRTDLSGNPRFREVVRRVRDVALGAYAHQEVPFEKLVAELQPERTLSHSPLFQVMFTLNEAAAEGPTPIPGLAVQAIDGDRRTTKFDLTLTCVRQGEGLATVLEYGTDLFDEETARRILEHLGRLAEQVAESPELRLFAVELLTDVERGEVLEAWNATERPYPPDCIHRLIEAQVARTPDAVALVHEGGRTTYAALNGGANRLARDLRGHGMGRGSFVPVLAERGPDVAVAMLAAMKAGAAFVPLDATWPEERLRRVLDDLRAPLLLAGAGAVDQARLLGRPVVPVELGEGDAANLETEVGADDPLYAIYTSGSTGVPKGAVVPHGGIANRFHWMTERFGAESARSVMQTTRHVYDSAVWQLFWPLTTGGRTVIPKADGETDAPYLVELIHSEAVTMTDFVPSVFNALVPELSADASARKRLASLRTVIVGGEQITAETTYRFIEHFPGVGVVNLYGPTECSIGSIHHLVSPADGSRIPIGRPIANTSALILDRGGRLVPQGVPGEIHLGGRCVGLGYIGDGKRTGAVFIPNPYAPRGGERLYRTGDVGRYRADGSIECLGRLDEQVKIRGFRIELGEIDAAIRRAAGVTHCAVVVRTESGGEPRLVAYFVGDAEADELRTHLRRSLPDYMVPAAFVPMETLPLTSNGKLDRKALPAPYFAAAPGALDEPESYVEVQLIQIWEELLGVRPIGPTQSFFDVGGTSLAALRLFSRVNRRFGCDLPVATLFTGATVRHMADAVLAQQASAPAPRAPVVLLKPGGSLPPLFVVHATDREVMGYINLVRHLGGDQPVYGVRDLAADLSRPLSVMAAEHMAEIRAVQPDGPYHLAGWSYGGLVAFEIASQFQRAGADVAFVGLLDAFSPALMRGSGLETATMLAAGAGAARRARRSLTLTMADLEGLPREEQIRRVAAHLQAQGPAVPGLDADTLETEIRVLRDRQRSRRGYAPAPFDGTLTLFRAGETAEAYAGHVARALSDPDERRTFGWSRLSTQPVAVHDVPGGHYSMMSEPHVWALVEHLHAALASACDISADGARPCILPSPSGGS